MLVVESVPSVIVTPLHYLFESNLTMAINAMSCTMFLGNFYHATHMIIKNQKPIYVLNLVQALIGLVVNLTILFTFFQFNVNCQARIYFAMLGNLVSMSCVEAILLIKAKMLTATSNYIIYVGYFLLGLKVAAFSANVATTTVSVTPLYNCSAEMSQLVGGISVGLELLVNFYLTVIFLSIIYKQYKFTKTPLYQTLIKDGLLFSVGTATTSVLIVILAFGQVLGSNSAALFNISWVVASSLTVAQLRHSSKLKHGTKSGKVQPNSNSSGSNTKQNSKSKETGSKVKLFNFSSKFSSSVTNSSTTPDQSAYNSSIGEDYHV